MKKYRLKNIFKIAVFCIGFIGYAQNGTAQINTVSVFGTTSHHFSKNFTNNAYQFGKLLSQKNKVVFYEGGTTGLINEIIRGVNENKGQSIIIATQNTYENNCPINHLCRQTEWVSTETLTDQKKEMYKMGDAIIILPGDWSALSDFAAYAGLVEQGLLEKKPVIFLNLNHYWDNLRYQTEEMTRQKVLSKDNTMYISFIDKPRDVLSEADKIQKQIQKNANTEKAPH